MLNIISKIEIMVIKLRIISGIDFSSSIILTKMKNIKISSDLDQTVTMIIN